MNSADRQHPAPSRTVRRNPANPAAAPNARAHRPLARTHGTGARHGARRGCPVPGYRRHRARDCCQRCGSDRHASSCPARALGAGAGSGAGRSAPALSSRARGRRWRYPSCRRPTTGVRARAASCCSPSAESVPADCWLPGPPRRQRAPASVPRRERARVPARSRRRAAARCTQGDAVAISPGRACRSLRHVRDGVPRPLRLSSHRPVRDRQRAAWIS